ncbi:MAG: isocitrate dehydrogenase [Candidatus Sumerlaeia bacterium]|nr:isocitrate dehydrogenase [Candidatus Sumerlaeia bacterium]
MTPPLSVVLIEGDGIGPEIAAAVKKVFAAAEIPIQWVPARAGLTCVQDYGNGCPQETLDTIARIGVALKGPTTTPIGGGHKSVNVTIRKALDTYANVRPSRSLPGVETRFSGVNLLIVRENIEDTYGGIEHMQSRNVAQCLRLITRPGTEKVCRFAFELAVQQNRRRVTCVHKANIMKLTDGLFLEVFREVAHDYPDIQAADILVDNVCMQLTTHPEQFDLLVLPNLFGDIVSDLAAGLVGGLGVAPGGNIGDRCAVFEAVHGSAPDIAGLGRANPTAMLLSSVMMLRHMGLALDADRVEKALRHTLQTGIRTADLGGKATTMEFTDAVCREIETAPDHDRAAIAHHPALPTIHIKSPVYIPAQRRETVGFDIFIQSQDLPDLPPQVGPFRLTMISNRGTKVGPGGQVPDILLIDIHRCRFEADHGVDDSEVTKAIVELDQKGFTWVHVEKLRVYDGKPGFTKAQGQ